MSNMKRIIEMSNCCGVEIIEPHQGNTARCPDCKEMCKVIKFKIEEDGR